MEETKNKTDINFVKAAVILIGVYSFIPAFIKEVFAGRNLKEDRTEGVYAKDKKMPLRKSQDNPEVKLIYKNFLEHPNSHKSHELLHTDYVDRSAKIRALRAKDIKLTY